MTGPLDIPNDLDKARLSCRAVIETPALSRAKFDFDPDSGLFALAGILPAGMAFPLDFGFIPSTRGEDGDPVDILIVAEGQSLPVGCLVEARLLGVIEAEQTQTKDGAASTVRNDRLIGRLAESRAFANVETIDQLGESFCEELARFFKTYNRLKDRKFEVVRILGPDRAAELVEAAAA